MSTRSKIIIVGFGCSISGAVLQWGLGAGIFVAGILLFLSPTLDAISNLAGLREPK